jgi:hypothetical protein
MTYQQQGFDLLYFKEVNQRENLVNKFTRNEGGLIYLITVFMHVISFKKIFVNHGKTLSQNNTYKNNLSKIPVLVLRAKQFSPTFLV